MNMSYFSEFSMRRLISSAVNVIVQLNRLPDGKRRVTSISEVAGLEDDAVVTRELFTFVQKGFDDDGRIRGIFKGGGRMPLFTDHIKGYGMDLVPSLFDLEMEV